MGDRTYVSRAGLKLDHALRQFDVDVSGFTCADFGCNVGGFTDCLLQHGAAKVYAIDTGYGVLDWTLRNDPRVIVMERTNALHAVPHFPHGREAGSEGPEHESLGESPSRREGVPGLCDLVAIDLGWTTQRHAIPAALRWLKPNGRIITLIKPHYEATGEEKKQSMARGTLSDEAAEEILRRVINAIPDCGARVVGTTESPIRGAKSGRKSGAGGNIEYLALLTPTEA